MWPDKLIPFLIIGIVLVFTIAIPLWLLWKVLGRTGMSPWFTFLVLVPSLGPLIVLAMLAFGRWPAFEAAAGSAASTFNGPDGVTSPPAPPAAVSVPAAWLPDPIGAHRLRYWDGSVWTSQVGD